MRRKVNDKVKVGIGLEMKREGLGRNRRKTAKNLAKIAKWFE